jgi:hypothetical protein
MPNFTGSSRRDAPWLSDASLAALLAGAELPPGAGPELRPLADALAVLAGRPDGDELAGEADTLIAFRDHFGAPGRDRFGAPGTAHRGNHNRVPRPRYRPSPLAAAAAVATLLGLGGLATGAYAGALPTGLQRLAHDIIGAPVPRAQPAVRPSPAGPAATGQPGHGLCTAWAHAKAHGTSQQRAAAFAALAAAAGGPAHVTAYCRAALAPPSSGPAATPSPRAGKPTALPTPHGSGVPTVIPTPHGSGKPTAIPTPHGSGKPTATPTQHALARPTATPTPDVLATPTATPTPDVSARLSALPARRRRRSM